VREAHRERFSTEHGIFGQKNEETVKFSLIYGESLLWFDLLRYHHGIDYTLTTVSSTNRVG
jgi:hypothetical protein